MKEDRGRSVGGGRYEVVKGRRGMGGAWEGNGEYEERGGKENDGGGREKE